MSTSVSTVADLIICLRGAPILRFSPFMGGGPGFTTTSWSQLSKSGICFPISKPHFYRSDTAVFWAEPRPWLHIHTLHYQGPYLISASMLRYFHVAYWYTLPSKRNSFLISWDSMTLNCPNYRGKARSIYWTKGSDWITLVFAHPFPLPSYLATPNNGGSVIQDQRVGTIQSLSSQTLCPREILPGPSL